jgi:hypothetical protein
MSISGNFIPNSNMASKSKNLMVMIPVNCWPCVYSTGMAVPFRNTAGRISSTKVSGIKLPEGSRLDLVHEFSGQIVYRKLRVVFHARDIATAPRHDKLTVQ